MSWLEQLQIAHGNLRPPNILLEHDDNVKLCDFDNSCTYGEYIQGAHRLYYKLLGWDGFGQVGAASEQFAIGSSAYYIHKGGTRILPLTNRAPRAFLSSEPLSANAGIRPTHPSWL